MTSRGGLASCFTGHVAVPARVPVTFNYDPLVRHGASTRR